MGYLSCVFGVAGTRDAPATYFAYIPVMFAPSDGINTFGSIISSAPPSIKKSGVFRQTVSTGGDDSKYFTPSLVQIPS